MRQKLKAVMRQDAGSGIVWALTVAGFLLIIVGAVLTISLVYHNRSLKNDDQRQAYLTARSGADMIVSEFTAGSSTALEIYQHLQERTTWTVDDVGFDEEMGSCALTVRLDKPENSGSRLTITVTADAVKGNARQVIVATLAGVYADNDSSEPGAAEQELIWTLLSYRDGSDGSKEAGL